MSLSLSLSLGFYVIYENVDNLQSWDAQKGTFIPAAAFAPESSKLSESLELASAVYAVYVHLRLSRFASRIYRTISPTAFHEKTLSSHLGLSTTLSARAVKANAG